MKNTKKALLVLLVSSLGGLMMLACLYTRHDIHITLDIRHIQQTASNIEDVVSGEKDLQDIKPKSGSMLLTTRHDWIARLIDPVASAYAQEGGDAIKEMTPELEKAIQNRKARAAEIREYKSAGAVGENKLALLETRPAPLLKEKGDEIRAAVKAENRDRQLIYEEIARQNGKTSIEDLTSIQQAWAEVNRAKSKPGDWVQVPTDPKYLRRFMASDIAKDLSAKPTPGSWVKVPEGYTPKSD